MSENTSNNPVRIAGTGSYLPEKELTNKDMESIVDTTDEWITSRTGIKSRRIAADNEHTSDLATPPLHLTHLLQLLLAMCSTI